jgi:alkylation response protein AidB-like acyl-CoA dehydrogenase
VLLSLSEPEAGSDATKQRTMADKKDNITFLTE